MGEINFSGISTKCLTIGDIRSKVSLTFWVIVTRIYMIYFRELDDHPSEEECSMSQFSFANNVEPTASFNIILLFLTINFRDET